MGIGRRKASEKGGSPYATRHSPTDIGLTKPHYKPSMCLFIPRTLFSVLYCLIFDNVLRYVKDTLCNIDRTPSHNFFNWLEYVTLNC